MVKGSKILVLALMTGGLVTLGVAQQGDTASQSPSAAANVSGVSAADQRFVKEAADGGMAEVELGRLASEKASNDDVKKFGQRMVDDHSKANDQLKQLASSKGITLPSQPSAKHKATLDRLSKLSGDQFDKAYMSDMLADHKKDVAAFQRESRSGSDPDVKSFAAQTLPTLQDHLKNAQSLAPKVLQARGSSASSSPSPEPASQSPN